MIEKVIIFGFYIHRDELEEEINRKIKYLKNTNCNILDIKFSAVSNMNVKFYTAMIIYDEL